MEVYRKHGSTLIHYGACPITGGPIFKPAVKGRTDVL